MSSILIVDDEELVRSLVMETIDFASIGFHEVWEAEDGELAYDIVAERHPDIVMTDIRMPFMDGLELAEKIRKNYPNTKIIILTGHDEFEYAKKALQLGVTDYIVKPIKPDELTALLKTAAEKLEAERTLRLEQTRIKRQLKESLPLLQERAMLSALTGSASGLAAKLQTLSVNVESFTSFTACVFDIDGQTDDEEELTVGAKDLIRSAAGAQGLTFSDAEGKPALLLFDMESQNDVHEMIDRIRTRINDKLSASCACGIGAPVEDIEDVAVTVGDAQRSLSRMTAGGNNRTYDSGSTPAVRFTYPKKEVAELVGAIELNMPYAAALRALTAKLSEGGVSVDNLRLVYNDILSSVLRVLLFASVEVPMELSSEARRVKLRTMAEFDDKLNSVLGTAAHLLENVKIPRKRLIVENAKSFIDINYSDPDLSLNSVAREAFISPSYLSMLFTREAGMSFVDYITKTRMEAAKQLLRQQDIKTYEVAGKVGFRDPHYFSVAFKKYTGSTPSGYKKQS